MSASEKDRLALVWGATERAGALTVGDIQGFARRGGVIGFFLEGNRVRFEVNVDAAERSRLRLNSKLLRLARVIRESEK